ncbi:MAG: cytochrome c3 family protein [Anaerolineae bacterium]
MKSSWVLGFMGVLWVLAVAVAGIAWAGDIWESDIMARHMHMGGPNHECVDCHFEGGRADPPPILRGRYANMGGPNHECGDCHDGVKAPLLPLPDGYTSCADCHPMR